MCIEEQTKNGWTPFYLGSLGISWESGAATLPTGHGGDCWLLQFLDMAVCLRSYLAFLKLVVILASRSRPFLLTTQQDVVHEVPSCLGPQSLCIEDG